MGLQRIIIVRDDCGHTRVYECTNENARKILAWRLQDDYCLSDEELAEGKRLSTDESADDLTIEEYMSEFYLANQRSDIVEFQELQDTF